MFPGARYYRYGGDEFLVVTYKPAEQNYGGQSYSFDEKLHGIRVSLSIGSAKGEPANYQEFFDLVSSADKALYVVKGRTHSAEYPHGGHSANILLRLAGPHDQYPTCSRHPAQSGRAGERVVRAGTVV
jgi:GGDEF domain-containing protein